MRLSGMDAAVVGLGLMGGSVAYALKRAGIRAVRGTDLDSDTLLLAEAAGAIDSGHDDPDDALREADLVFLCIGASSVAPFIRDHASAFKKGALVTDTAGVRRGINDSVTAVLPPGVRYVGGHPMAGKENSGFRASDPDIFRGASWIITALEGTPSADVEELAWVARALGAERIHETDEDTHDEQIAYTSHLPHAIAAALVRNPLIASSTGFTGGSFRDATRVARINADMWADLFLANADELLPAIATFQAELGKIRDAVEAKDRPALKELLAEARRLKDKKG